MLAIVININAFLLAGIILISIVVGFIFRSAQLGSLRKKVADLEKEMLSNHADILDLQKEKALLEHTLEESKIPVIPLNTLKDENPDKLPDGAHRKKMLAQQSAKRHS